MYDTEKGYVRIANELLEDITKLPLSGNCYKVLFWAMRNSYGYNRKNTAPASITEIAKAVELGKSSAHLSLNSLLKIGVLKKLKDGAFYFDKNAVKKALTVHPNGRLSSIPMDGKIVHPNGRTVHPNGRSIYIRRKDNLKDRGGEGEGRPATASAPVLGLSLPAPTGAGPEQKKTGEKMFPEADIFAVGEAYIKAKGLSQDEAAKTAFLKRSKNYYAFKDILTQAQGNVPRAVRAIIDLGKYYGDKDWNINWIADKDYAEWDKERIDDEKEKARK